MRILHPSAPLALLTLLLPSAALAHGGLPAEAILVTPNNIEVFDQSVGLEWVDSDTSIPTGTATVNLFYTDAMPPTFEPGTRPDAVVGTQILEGLPEYDPTNTFEWDTSQVPSGTYWVWSLVEEPPEPMPSPQIIHFTPVPIVIAHPGDDVPPAIRITNPDNPFVWADQEFRLEYEAFDPSGNGRVKLEATDQFDGTGFFTIAEDLPAVADGVFMWDVSELAEIDWTLRATITDDRGFEVTAYGQHFLLITHLQAPDMGVGPDMGAMDSGALDTGPRPDAGVSARDAGQKLPAPKSGCSCSAAPPTSSASLLSLLGLLVIFRRRR